MIKSIYLRHWSRSQFWDFCVPGVKLDNLDDARKFFRDIIKEKADELWAVNSQYFKDIDDSLSDASDLANKMDGIALDDEIFNFIK